MTARDDHRGPTVQNLPADQLHLGNPGYRHVDAFIEQLSATAMPQRLPSCRDPRCLLPQLPPIRLASPSAHLQRVLLHIYALDEELNDRS
jgi:hypothetical protein